VREGTHGELHRWPEPLIHLTGGERAGLSDKAATLRADAPSAAGDGGLRRLGVPMSRWGRYSRRMDTP
jgi:hypothetical protein